MYWIPAHLPIQQKCWLLFLRCQPIFPKTNVIGSLIWKPSQTTTFQQKKTWMVPIITGNTIIHRKILVVVWKFPSQTHSESKWVAAIHQEPSGNLRVCYWKWMKMAHRNSWFTYFTSKKWWLSIVMLVYQRVNLHFPIVFPEFSYDFPIKTSVSPAPGCHIPAGRLRWLVPSPCYWCDRRTWMTGDHGTWMTCFI